MRKSVEEAWIGFSTRFEGRIQWMYLDILGLVTTGIGNLIDPKPAALSLPWRHVGTYERATVGEISVEWDMMKSRKGLAQTGASRVFRCLEVFTASVLPQFTAVEKLWTTCG